MAQFLKTQTTFLVLKIQTICKPFFAFHCKTVFLSRDYSIHLHPNFQPSTSSLHQYQFHKSVVRIKWDYVCQTHNIVTLQQITTTNRIRTGRVCWLWGEKSRFRSVPSLLYPDFILFQLCWNRKHFHELPPMTGLFCWLGSKHHLSDVSP